LGTHGVTRSKDKADIESRQAQNRVAINSLDRENLSDEPARKGFFQDVYRQAGGDADMVPWADLAAKASLVEWLAKHPGEGRLSAIDVACGLGDNAEALANAGYVTTAFDVSTDAIRWARERFPDTSVTYQTADLFDLPQRWNAAFDLVHECYTLQALPPEMLGRAARAIAALVKPGGTLLVYTRFRPDGSHVDGPPWPLEQSALALFGDLGFDAVAEHRFDIQRPGRPIPHAFIEWRKV
jgi:2-polyprenyl-3-methyl-5-hydroxy-6-metoxy-1,4-benzoquinol methylase